MIRVMCPVCGWKAEVAESQAGRRIRCGECRQRLLVPSASGKTPDIDMLPSLSERIGAWWGGLFARPQAVHPQIQPRPEEVETDSSVALDFVLGGCSVHLFTGEDGNLSCGIEDDTSEEMQTVTEVGEFLKFYMATPVGLVMMMEHRWTAIERSFNKWRDLQRPRDEEGKLEEPVPCIALDSRQQLCGKFTRDPSGLCRNHRGPDVSTIWNTEWTKRRMSRQTRQGKIEKDRERRIAKWGALAAKIESTATERQLCLLLDRGVSPQELQGTDKATAGKMIHTLHYEGD